MSALKLTQKDRVLYELRQAGEKGIRSDTWYELHLPRAAARIKELREEGYEISSTNEHPFVRYTLVEVGAGLRPREADNRASYSADLSKLDAIHSDSSHRTASKAGVEQVPTSLLPEEPVPPAESSMYDPYSEAA